MLIHVNSAKFNSENSVITIEEAFQLLGIQSDLTQLEENFIGFTSENNEQCIIQFVRMNAVNWVLDIPTFIDSEFSIALIATIKHETVFQIVRDFFDPNTTLFKLLDTKQYDLLKSEFKSLYGIVLEKSNEE